MMRRVVVWYGGLTPADRAAVDGIATAVLLMVLVVLASGCAL